jgi:hypothetical protein
LTNQAYKDYSIPWVPKGSTKTKEKRIMAKLAKKNPSFENGLPDKLPAGFEPVSSKLDGWFVVEAGNQIQGFLRDSFFVKGQFGEKKIYKIEITEGTTKAIGPDKGETDLGGGAMVGLDEKGWLKALSSIKKDTEIFVRCLGQEETARKGQNPAWKFLIGAVPI